MTVASVQTFAGPETLERRRSGRPARAIAERLPQHIVAVARAEFLTHGYGATSIEAIARLAGVSKRTLYERFANKRALFGAVVQSLIGELRPPSSVPLIEGSDLPAILRHLGILILEAALQPSALALYRLLIAEGQRFPELALVLAQSGGREEAIGLIGRILAEHSGLGAEQRRFAAEQYLQLLVSRPQSLALVGQEHWDRARIEAWVDQSVQLFVNGVAGFR